MNYRNSVHRGLLSGSCPNEHGSSDAQNRDVRRPNNSIAVTVLSQMAANRIVSDDQDVSLSLFGRSVQQLRDIAVIDDDFGLRAHVLLKLGDLLSGEADDRFLPHGST